MRHLALWKVPRDVTPGGWTWGWRFLGKCTIEVIEATETSTECPDGGSLWQLIAVIAEGPGCLTGAKLHRSTKGMPWVGCHHLAANLLSVHLQADYLTTSCTEPIPDILGSSCRSCRRTVGKEPNVPTVASSADSGPVKLHEQVVEANHSRNP